MIIQKENPPYKKHQINSNAFIHKGIAKRYCKQMGLDYKVIVDEMMNGDYEHLLEVFDREFGMHIN